MSIRRTRVLVAVAAVALSSVLVEGPPASALSPTTAVPGLPGGNTQFTDVNDAGLVVGNSTTSAGDIHAIAWSTDDGLTDLDTFGGHESWPSGLNASGQVVGYSTDSADAAHAFVWTKATGLQDLGVASPAVGVDINDA